MKSPKKLPPGWTLLKNDAGRYSVESPFNSHHKRVSDTQDDGGTRAQAIALAWKIHRDIRSFDRAVRAERKRWKEVK